MYKKYTILLLLLWCSIPLFAQLNVPVEKSGVFKNKRGDTHVIGTFADQKGGLVTVYTTGHGYVPEEYHVSHFDRDLNLVAEKEFKIDDNYFRGLLIKDEMLYLFEFRRNKDTKKYDFNVLSSPLDNFEFQRKTLLSVKDKNNILRYYPKNQDYVSSGPLENADGLSFHNVVFSKNKKFFSVTFSDPKNLRVIVFDMNFEKVLDKKIFKTLNAHTFNYEDIRVSNDGSVYYLGKYLVSPHTYPCTDCFYALLTVNNEGFTISNLESETNFVTDLTLVLTANGWTAVGFYSQKSGDPVQGIVRLHVDDVHPKLSSTFLPFSMEFWQKKTDRYGFAEAHLMNNGDIVLSAELHWAHSSQHGNTSKVIDYFEDIISFKISKEGQLLWEHIIEKKQISRGSRSDYLSYCTAYHDGKVYYFYQENKDDLKKNLFSSGENPGMDFYRVEIDEHGKMTTKNILPNHSNSFDFYVRYGESVDNQMIFIGNDGRKKQLISISY